MIRIADTIFSLDVLTKQFRCNIAVCLGNCCRYGDSGAPLTEAEVRTLKEIYPSVKPYLRPAGIESIEKKGFSILDFENETVTPLVGDEECAYSILDGNIFMCGIEKAFMEGKIDFQKPLSCHLFPVRIKQYKDFRAVNYQELSICNSALEKGREEGIYVYQFLKEPLIRALGDEIYNELCIAADELRSTGSFR